MKATSFPYSTLRGDVELTVSDARIDGTPLPPDDVQANDRLIALHGQEIREWQRLTFRVDVQTNPGLLRQYEDEHGSVTLSVIASCRPTNVRQPIRLGRSTLDPSIWSGKAELHRSHFRDKVQIQAQLTAKVGGVAHRPVSSSDSWTLYFDPSESFRVAGSLRVVWYDFKSASAPPIARQFPDSAYVVDLERSLPEILLNKSFEGLEPILRDAKDRSPTELALHDIARMSIARSVWQALVYDAMSAIQMEDDVPTWPEREWHAEVLRRILPEIDPGKSETELLHMASVDWRQHPGSGSFAARSEAVIGDLIGANKSLRKSTQALIRRGIVT
ncbi:MAG: hypothetical protein EXQ69_06060 [Acidimicrobiia bacterium]|nr:hypothetical protein [Acidimicrobiia bacterium]